MTVSTRSPGAMTSTRCEERTRGAGAGAVTGAAAGAAVPFGSSLRTVAGPAASSSASAGRIILIRP
jgi:hypothetical protein